MPASRRTLKVGVVQQQAWPDKAKSLAASEAAIRRLAADGAELVMLQELHASHYFCQTEDTDLFDLAEAIDGPTTQRLADLAAELELVIVGSIFERRAAGVYHNTAVVLDKASGLVGTFRKMHIPDDPASTRSSTSRRAMPRACKCHDVVSSPSIPPWGALAYKSAGTSGIRKAHA